MKAQLLYQPTAIDENPLNLKAVDLPSTVPDKVLIRVHTCGVCHTDLHLVEGELPNPKVPVIPGHEIIGTVEAMGEMATRFSIGDRVGAFWMHQTCGRCFYCENGLENLCDTPLFNGYTADGGYAEYVAVPQDFVVPIPDHFNDVDAAPLMCAGIVGYRSLRLSDIQPGERLGLYGFGASAHICIQVARHWGCEVYVFTRSEAHKNHARDLGAAWVGEAGDTPPKPIDRGIIFAPAGWIVKAALGHLRKGGTLAINAIHMSDIPELPYHLLWHERTIRSVANTTRRDAEEFLPLAAEIPVHLDTVTYDLDAANHVLNELKASTINGAAVLKVR